MSTGFEPTPGSHRSGRAGRWLRQVFQGSEVHDQPAARLETPQAQPNQHLQLAAGATDEYGVRSRPGVQNCRCLGLHEAVIAYTQTGGICARLSGSGSALFHRPDMAAAGQSGGLQPHRSRAGAYMPQLAVLPQPQLGERDRPHLQLGDESTRAIGTRSALLVVAVPEAEQGISIAPRAIEDQNIGVGKIAPAGLDEGKIRKHRLIRQAEPGHDRDPQLLPIPRCAQRPSDAPRAVLRAGEDRHQWVLGHCPNQAVKAVLGGCAQLPITRIRTMNRDDLQVLPGSLEPGEGELQGRGCRQELEGDPGANHTIRRLQPRPRDLRKSGPAIPQDADQGAGLTQARPPPPSPGAGHRNRRQGHRAGADLGSAGAGCAGRGSPGLDGKARRGRGSPAAPRQSGL